VSALRIAVGFKVTPDYEALRPADWARAADQGTIEVPYVSRVLNVFDESALEVALRVRDERAGLGLATELAAFSVAGREAEPYLRTLQALAYERAVRVEAGGDLDFAPAATAHLIAACAERLGGDVLLLGCRSGPGDSGTVPHLVAAVLARPCLTQVTEITAAQDGHLRVTFVADRGAARASIMPPCVLAVGNALVSMVRVPTLQERLAVRDRPLRVFSPHELGVDVAAALAREPAELLGLETVDRGRGGARLEGGTPEEKARALYETYLRAELEQL
jgi:electron transfer flavoprotein alpha/beta subunit